MNNQKKKLIPFLLGLSFTCQAEMKFCFELEAIDPLMKNEWTDNVVVLYSDKIRSNIKGRQSIALDGYGYNFAPTPKGSTDLVPLTGGAVKDIDGRWHVTILGSLVQESILAYTNGLMPYYIISHTWDIDPVTGNGIGQVGNVTSILSPYIPNVQDDSYTVTVSSVDCNLVD